MQNDNLIKIPKPIRTW